MSLGLKTIDIGKPLVYSGSGFLVEYASDRGVGAVSKESAAE